MGPTIIDRFLFREWLKSFVVALAVVVGLLILSEVYDDLPDFIESNEAVGTIIRYYLLVVPGYLPALLPLAFLVSVLFTLTGLHRNSETTAMRAAGMSLWHISRSLFVAAALLALLLFWLNASVVPRAVESSRQLHEDTMRKTYGEEGRIIVGSRARALGVRDPEMGRLWFVEAFDNRIDTAYRVEIHQGHDWRIEADRAVYDREKGVWNLAGVRILSLDPESGMVTGFEKRETLTREDIDLSPDVLVGLSQDPDKLSLIELDAVLNGLDPREERYSAYAVRYQVVLATPFQFLVILLLCTPLATRGVRVNPAVGLSKAMGLFFIFFVLTRLASMAGEGGFLPPLAAAWSPLVLANGFGIWLFLRDR